MKKRIQTRLLKERAGTKSVGRNLIKGLFEHGLVTTNLIRTKRLKSEADKLINTAFKEELVATRLLHKRLGDLKTVRLIINYAKTVKGKRKSGFTSIVHSYDRRGDAAVMGKLTLLDFVPLEKKVKKVVKKPEVQAK